MKRNLAACLPTLVLTCSPAFAGEKTVTLTVENMACALCPYIVQKVLAGVPGVTRAAVSFKDKTAIITFDDNKAGLAALTAATAGVGFPSHPVLGSGG
jgi:periplasmic mercuric ion binding protein